MSHTLFTSLLAIILFQGSQQAITLFNAKRCNTRANKTMGFFIVVCMIMAIDSFLHYTGYIKEVPFLVRVFTPLYGLTGVSLFCYSKCLTDKDFRYNFKALIYLVPVLLSYISYAPVFFYPEEQKIAYALGTSGLTWRTFVVVFGSLFNIFFLVTGYLKLRKYHQNIRDHYSNLSALQLIWLERVFLIVLFLAISAFLVSVITASQGFQSTYLAFFTCSFLMILFNGFSALKQIDPLFIIVDELKQSKKAASTQAIKKEITPEQIESIKTSLERLINDQIYLDPDIKLSKLAQKANYPSYLISHVLNQDYEMSFFEFINTYRINEAKKRLLETQFQHLTILAIAEDVGFSSKSSFNATFKRMVGQTPSQFRRTNSPN